jgi:dephospho-CoA kinase|eukprot:evm.model.NODE_17396_length_17094_cov_22.943489.6
MSGAKRLFIHGLTGGIATGKSHACGVLQALGATILHADLLAHQCYAPQTPANEKLRQAFGTSIFTADGEVDRAKLGKLVFSEEQQLLKLNEIMFPVIERRTKEEVARLEMEERKWVVVEAAVLFEAGWERWMDEVWTVVVDPAVARLRLMERNDFTAMEAEARIRAQMSNEERVKRARVVIDSKGSKEETAGKIKGAVDDMKKRVKMSHGLDLV